MNSQSIRVAIARGGDFPTVRRGLSADDVGDVTRGLEGEPDVTVEVAWEGTTDKCLVFGVSDLNVFLGMEGNLDGIFQYVSRDNANIQGSRRFLIKGERTDIESRYVLDIGTAAAVVQEWLTSGEDSSMGWWERQ